MDNTLLTTEVVQKRLEVELHFGKVTFSKVIREIHMKLRKRFALKYGCDEEALRRINEKASITRAN